MSSSTEAAGLFLLATFWCFMIVLIFALTVLIFWLFLACVIDAIKKDESTFKHRNLWLIVLIVSFLFGVGFVPSLVYYILYKPKFKFWQS